MVSIVLSFDDGRRDNYIAFKEILEPLKIPATFNITSGYIEKTIENKDLPGPHEPMRIEELIIMSESSIVEIAGHGYTHDNDPESIVKGIRWLRNICDKQTVSGVASPHSEYNLANLERDIITFQQQGIRYLRISNDYTKYNFANRAARKIAKITHVPFFYYYANKDSIIKDSSGYIIHSVPVLKVNRLNEVEGFIEYLIKRNKNEKAILMFHSILKPDEQYYDDLFSWDYKDFYDLCSYMDKKRSENQISIVKTVDLLGKDKK